ncbi:hypothetical protein V502_08409, partial [Pseudogymnoascus sp. VKM F-4520 (FW-2644)]
HYDFYYFIINKTLGPNKRLLFDYSAEAPPDTTPAPTTSDEIPENYNPLSRPSNTKSAAPATVPIADLDGANDDPTFTKVVDRRWYERNKHIYPASVWQEFDPEKDYQTEAVGEEEGEDEREGELYGVGEVEGEAEGGGDDGEEGGAPVCWGGGGVVGGLEDGHRACGVGEG